MKFIPAGMSISSMLVILFYFLILFNKTVSGNRIRMLGAAFFPYLVAVSAAIAEGKLPVFQVPGTPGVMLGVCNWSSVEGSAESS